MAVATDREYGLFIDGESAESASGDVRALMATVWTGDPARGHRIAARIKSGTVGINMPYTAFPGIPFGGYNQSGFGRELALETLESAIPTSVRDRSYRSRSAGASTGRPIRTAEKLACAAVPAARTTQR